MRTRVMIGAVPAKARTIGGFSRSKPKRDITRIEAAIVRRAACASLARRGIDQLPDAFSGRQKLSY